MTEPTPFEEFMRMYYPDAYPGTGTWFVAKEAWNAAIEHAAQFMARRYVMASPFYVENIRKARQI